MHSNHYCSLNFVDLNHQDAMPLVHCPFTLACTCLRRYRLSTGHVQDCRPDTTRKSSSSAPPPPPGGGGEVGRTPIWEETNVSQKLFGSEAHKTEFWYPLRVLFKISDDHSFTFISESPSRDLQTRADLTDGLILSI